jgi:hypothetical protein
MPPIISTGQLLSDTLAHLPRSMQVLSGTAGSAQAGEAGGTPEPGTGWLDNRNAMVLPVTADGLAGGDHITAVLKER